MLDENWKSSLKNKANQHDNMLLLLLKSCCILATLLTCEVNVSFAGIWS